MTLPRFILLTVIAACPAFSQTVIMGHHIGETVPQFLAVEPGLQSRIDTCRASEPKPMTPDQIHALSKQDANALAEQVFAANQLSPDSRFPMKWVPKRGQLEDFARQGMVIAIDKRMPDVIATCHSLLSLTAPPSSTPVLVKSLPGSRPRPITWRFKNGALFQIDIDFHGAVFSEVAGDVTSKTKVQPNESKEVDTPNLYGATIQVYRKATWLTPELYALLEDSEGTVDGQMYLSIISRAEYDEWAKTHLKKGSLD
jgi:hypothetical protein